jgi:hypothetical protein
VIPPAMGKLEVRYGIPRNGAPVKQRALPPQQVRQLTLFGIL